MSNHTSRTALGSWVGNVALYPIAFSVPAVVLVLLERAFPGIDDVPLHEPIDNPIGLMFGYAMGMMLYWAPGVAASLAALALLSRLPDTSFRAAARLVTPLGAVGA